MPQNHTPGGWQLGNQTQYQRNISFLNTLFFIAVEGENKAVRERPPGGKHDKGCDLSTYPEGIPCCKDQTVKINRWPEKVIFRCDEFNNHLGIFTAGFPLRTAYSILLHLSPLSDDQIRQSLLAVLISVIRLNNSKGDDRSKALKYLHSLVPVCTVDGRLMAHPDAMYYFLTEEQMETLKQKGLPQSIRAFEHELTCTLLPDLRFPAACTRRHSCKQIHQSSSVFLNALKRVVDSGAEFNCRPNGIDKDAHKFCAFHLCSQCTKEACPARHFEILNEEEEELSLITIKEGRSPNQISAEEEDESEEDEMMPYCPEQVIRDAMESCRDSDAEPAG